ncbi:MAG: hypothetical protein QGG64_28275, partial [Candidatus Latescibacteria bacterium]|nr:hypothetical protein [Candidatus Latescibacterota bacterium]
MTKQPFEITDTPTWICVGKLISGDTSPPISNAHIVFDRTAIHYVGGETPPAHIVQNEQKQPDTTLPNHT